MPVAGNPAAARSQASYVTNLPNSPSDITVTVMHVFPDINAAEEGGNIDVKEYVDEDPDSVKTAVEVLEDADIDTSIVRESGEPDDQILSYASERDPDGIVVGGKKRSPVGKALLGSVTQAIVLNAEQPVTVTKRSEGQ